MDIAKRKRISEILESKTKLNTVSAWVHEKRDLGKLKFITLRDATGFLQMTLKTADEKIVKIFDSVSKESIILSEGEIIENKKAPNGKEFIPKEMEIISSAEAPLPIEFSGKIETSLDKRFDWRFIDLKNPKVMAVFLLENHIIDYVEEYFKKNNYMRMFSSRIVGSPTEGGTEYFPILYFNKQAFLAQSPQFYKEAILSSGIDKIYDIGFVYRAEPHHTTRHVCEYVSIDFEIAFIKSMEDVMKEEENLLKFVMKKLKENDEKIFKMFEMEIPEINEIPRITLETAKEIVKKMGITPEEGDLTHDGESALGKWVLEKYKSRFVFLTNFPWKEKPFYVMKEKNNSSASFDLLFDGLEITSGGQREHKFIEREKNCRERGLNPESFDHLRFFKFGMPPHGGMAIGLERITSKLLGLKNVKEAVLLPRDPDRLIP